MSHGRVLIVDDEENLCRILSRVLRDEGYEVETAQDGDVATETRSSHRAISLMPAVSDREPARAHCFLTHWPSSSWTQSFGRERS